MDVCLLETITTPGTCLCPSILLGRRRRLYNQRQWFDRMSHQHYRSGRQPHGSDFSVLACKKSYPGGCLGMSRRNRVAALETIKLQMLAQLARIPIAGAQSSRQIKGGLSHVSLHAKCIIHAREGYIFPSAGVHFSV